MVNLFQRGNNLEIYANGGTLKLIPFRALRVEPQDDFVWIKDIESNCTMKYDYTEITGKNDTPLGAKEDIIDYLSAFVGFNNASSGGGGGTIDLGDFQNSVSYSGLTAGTIVGEIAYVRQSQGISWLPGTIGGTYYPSGWYSWDGTNWVSDRNAIANELENLVLSNQAITPSVNLNTDHRMNMNNPHNVLPTPTG